MAYLITFSLILASCLQRLQRLLFVQETVDIVSLRDRRITPQYTVPEGVPTELLNQFQVLHGQVLPVLADVADRVQPLVVRRLGEVDVLVHAHLDIVYVLRSDEAEEHEPPLHEAVFHVFGLTLLR